MEEVVILNAAILRALDQDPSALLAESSSIDPLDMGVRYEKALICGSMEEWKRMMRRPAHNYLELSLDYMKAGFYEDARNILAACEDPSPMVSYYLGYAWEKDRTGSTVPGTSSDSGHTEDAKEAKTRKKPMQKAKPHARTAASPTAWKRSSS